MHVELDDVGHRFPDAPWLFHGVAMRLVPGVSYAMTGPSGSGKSTLLSLIAGWIPPTEGAVGWHGITKTNWIFQNSYGMPRRLAIDHVVLPFLARGFGRKEANARATDLLGRFGLVDLGGREFRHLSGGEAQRLMFARALAAEPQLILVDEPTAQLDLVTTRQVNRVIGELSAEGRIVVVATHDPETVNACDVRVDLSKYSYEDS